MSADTEYATEAGKPDYGKHSEVRDLNEALRELHTESTITLPNGKPAIVLPVGRTLNSVKALTDEYLEKPERRVGTSKPSTLESFIAIVNRFATGHSAVFAAPDISAPSLTGVFDYHPATVAGVSTPADWLKHRAVYAPALSEEWKIWLAKNGVMMDQAAFATFIEDRATNLVVPNLDDDKTRTYANLVQGVFAEPTDLIRLSRGMEVSVGIKVKSLIRLSSGEISMQFDETHSDGAGEALKVPNLFQIMIPVFYAGEWYRIAATLRYRISQGATVWGYQLVQPELAFKNAFEEMSAKVKAETSVPVFFGAPES